MAKPMLACIGLGLMGPSGAGQVTKPCNQVIVGSNIALIAEAIRLAQHMRACCQVCWRAASWIRNPCRFSAPRMIDLPLESIGAANTMPKDLDTALDLGRDTGTPLPVSGLAAQLLRTLAAQGKGEEELSALIDLYGKGA